MTFGIYVRQFHARAAALVVVFGCVGAAGAADQTPPVVAAPTVGATACPTCEGAPAACATCGKAHFSLLQKHGCKPYAPHLCPGACFGYFQTQWHHWENVCPIPYQGTDLAAAPPRLTPPVNPPLIPAKPADSKGSDTPLTKPGPMPTMPVPPPIMQ